MEPQELYIIKLEGEFTGTMYLQQYDSDQPYKNYFREFKLTLDKKEAAIFSSKSADRLLNQQKVLGLYKNKEVTKELHDPEGPYHIAGCRPISKRRLSAQSEVIQTNMQMLSDAHFGISFIKYLQEDGKEAIGMSTIFHRYDDSIQLYDMLKATAANDAKFGNMLVSLAMELIHESQQGIQTPDNKIIH